MDGHVTCGKASCDERFFRNRVREPYTGEQCVITLYLGGLEGYFDTLGEQAKYVRWVVGQLENAFPYHRIEVSMDQHLIGVETDDDWRRERIVEFCGTLLERYERGRPRKY